MEHQVMNASLKLQKARRKVVADPVAVWEQISKLMQGLHPSYAKLPNASRKKLLNKARQENPELRELWAQYDAAVEHLRELQQLKAAHDKAVREQRKSYRHGRFR